MLRLGLGVVILVVIYKLLPYIVVGVAYLIYINIKAGM